MAEKDQDVWIALDAALDRIERLERLLGRVNTRAVMAAARTGWNFAKDEELDEL